MIRSGGSRWCEAKDDTHMAIREPLRKAIICLTGYRVRAVEHSQESANGNTAIASQLHQAAQQWKAARMSRCSAAADHRARPLAGSIAIRARHSNCFGVSQAQATVCPRGRAPCLATSFKHKVHQEMLSSCNAYHVTAFPTSRLQPARPCSSNRHQPMAARAPHRAHARGIAASQLVRARLCDERSSSS